MNHWVIALPKLWKGFIVFDIIIVVEFFLGKEVRTEEEKCL